jgi:hypothetical protein
MRNNVEILQKKGLFLVKKYLVSKGKIQYIVKGLVGALLWWLIRFHSIYGSFSNYELIVTELRREVSASESLRNQLETFSKSPLFILGMVSFVVTSLVLGYLVVSVIQMIADIVRGRVFQGFTS